MDRGGRDRTAGPTHRPARRAPHRARCRTESRDLLGIREHTALELELVVFTVDQSGGVNLGHLKAEEIDPPRELALVLTVGLKLSSNSMNRLGQLLYFSGALAEPSKPIQQANV